MSVNTYYRYLKEYLINSSDQVQKSKEDIGTLFSTTHFTTFLKYAYRHFSETVDRPFNFIRVLKIYSPMPFDLDEYLSTFLKHVKSLNKLMEFIVLIITFNIFLDSYPPKAYSKYSLPRTQSC